MMIVQYLVFFAIVVAWSILCIWIGYRKGGESACRAWDEYRGASARAFVAEADRDAILESRGQWIDRAWTWKAETEKAIGMTSKAIEIIFDLWGQRDEAVSRADKLNWTSMEIVHMGVSLNQIHQAVHDAMTGFNRRAEKREFVDYDDATTT